MNLQEYAATGLIVHARYPLIFLTISGAHQYGFESKDSDIDLRGVYVLPVHEIAGLQMGKETFEVEWDEGWTPLDMVTHDVAKFCRLLLGKNGNVLENLYSPLIVHTSSEHQELKYLASQCITRYHYKHYQGFAEKQWKLLHQEHQRDKKGVKALLYLYRVLLTGTHLMQTGRVEANLVKLSELFKLPYLPDLIARKLAGHEHEMLSEDEVQVHTNEYHRLHEALYVASEHSSLPVAVTTADKEMLHQFVLRTRLGRI